MQFLSLHTLKVSTDDFMYTNIANVQFPYQLHIKA